MKLQLTSLSDRHPRLDDMSNEPVAKNFSKAGHAEADYLAIMKQVEAMNTFESMSSKQRAPGKVDVGDCSNQSSF